MRTLILTLVLALSLPTFSQELLNDDLNITTEKLMKPGRWSHLEIYGYDTYDCNRRFFYKCIDKADQDTLINDLLYQYGIDTEDEGDEVKNDKGDMSRAWYTTQDDWDVTIYTYRNKYGKYMIYIRFE